MKEGLTVSEELKKEVLDEGKETKPVTVGRSLLKLGIFTLKDGSVAPPCTKASKCFGAS